MKGTFSEEALLQFANLASQTQSADFSEGETYDFTRCVRPDGKVYGTRGKCRKGTEQAKDDDEKAAIKQLGGMLPKGEKIMDSKGGLHTAAGKVKERVTKKSAEAKAKENKGGMRDSSLAESRKAMRHQREQMNLHGNKIAELQDAGKKVPPALQAKYNLAKASYNSHRKAINDATGVMNRPVMQAAREAGRAEEKKNQEKRAVQRGKEWLADMDARDKEVTPSSSRTRPKAAIESDMRKLTSSGAMQQAGLAGIKARAEHAALKAELRKPLKDLEGTSGINLSKVKAAKEKLAADKAANGGKRLDRIQEEQRLARNKAQRELDAKGKAKSPADLATPQKQGKADVDRMKKYLQDESDKLKNLNDAQKQNPGRSNDPDVASRKAVLERNVAAVKNQLKKLEGKP